EIWIDGKNRVASRALSRPPLNESPHLSSIRHPRAKARCVAAASYRARDRDSDLLSARIASAKMLCVSRIRERKFLAGGARCARDAWAADFPGAFSRGAAMDVMFNR